MLNFLIRFTHKKQCEDTPIFPAQSNTATSSKESVTLEIDYDKLANAIVKANEISEEQKVKSEKAKQEQRQTDWRKALLGKKYDKGTSNDAPNYWETFWGLMLFKKEYATGDNAVYALLKLGGCFLLFLYEYLFYFLSYVPIKIAIGDFSLSLSQLTKVGACFGLLLLFLIIARVIRVARLQIKNCENGQFVVAAFNSLVAFTAMIFTIITLFITKK